jgi:malate synthase
MQEKYININKLKVSESLSRFVKDELLKDTNISSDDFWLGFEKTVEELEPKNRQLINFRETLQKKIDAWHIKINLMNSI